MEKKIIFDHLGVAFDSVTQMCQAHGVSFQTFSYRTKVKGMSLEEALVPFKYKIGRKPKTVPEVKVVPEVKDATKVYDHLGQAFNTEKEMCEAHGVKYRTYLYRKEKGVSLEKALKPVKHKEQLTAKEPGSGRSGKKCVDHKGNTYASLNEMSRAYGLRPKTILYRIMNGFTVEMALTLPAYVKFNANGSAGVLDHLGNAYPNVSQLCRKYGINTGTLSARLEKGWNMSQALTEPVKLHKKGTTYTKKAKLYLANGGVGSGYDIDGAHYASLKELAKAFGIKPSTLSQRLSYGWTLEEAVHTTPDSKGIHRRKDLRIGARVRNR